MRGLLVALMAIAVFGCSEEANEGGGAGGAAGAGGTGGSSPGSCAEGFAPDEIGCLPVLPAAACPPGEVALPGETACRPLMACEGRWGDAPIEAGTQFVDGSYAGGDSDGSEQRPWTTIGDALAVAPPNGVVAITDGDYHEALLLQSPVRLWGSCPYRVTVHGPVESAIVVLGGGAGSEIHDLAVTAPDICLHLMDSSARAERVWLHHCQGGAVIATSMAGTGGVTVVDSLLEDSTTCGVAAVLTHLETRGTVIRNIHATGEGAASAIMALQGIGGPPVVSHALLEQIEGYGVIAYGPVGLERVVIRNITTYQGLAGDGVTLIAFAGSAPSPITSTAIMNNARVGIASFSAHAQMTDLRLECNPVQLNGEWTWTTDEGETYEGDYTFEDLGGNLCACQGVDEGCQVLSTGISPPKL